MRDHRLIEERSLIMHRAIVDRIDADPARRGVQQARENLARWKKDQSLQVLEEWEELLERPWEEIRHVLLDPSEHGRRLRQSTPFCGILTPRERWEIYREFHETHSG